MGTVDLDQMRMIMAISKHVHKGQYRAAVKLFRETCENPELHVKNFILSMKRSRITNKHKQAIAGGSTNRKPYHYPWCSCGWRGPDVVSYDEAKAIQCPEEKRLLEKYDVVEEATL